MAGERLRIVEGPAVGTDVPLDEEFVVGRAQQGHGTLGDDQEISRRHARIAREDDDELWVEDLGSTNGTWVNGKQIAARTRLQPGDRLRLGATTLELLPEVGAGVQPTALSKGEAEAARAAAVPPRASDEPHTRSSAPAPSRPVRATAPARGSTATKEAASPNHRGRILALAAGGLALLALLGIVLSTRSSDPAKPKPVADPVLSPRQILARNKAATVIINTRGPGRDADGTETVTRAGGSGVVIDAKKGLVLTNAHVIAGQTSIRAGLADGKDQSSARVVGQAPCEDVALIQLQPVPKGLQAARIGSAAKLGLGDDVVALGYPGAFERDITERKLQTNEGNVTSEPGEVTLGRDLPRLPQVIESQAPINPGNSGGPLFDNRGRVVGINTVKTGGQAQSGSISIDRVKQVLGDLRQGRNQGYVGWDLKVVPLDNGKGLPLVLGVDPDSPGDSSGLRFGDIIRRVQDTIVNDVPDVCDILGSKAPGDRLKVSGIRLSGGRGPFTARLRLR